MLNRTKKLHYYMTNVPRNITLL